MIMQTADKNLGTLTFWENTALHTNNNVVDRSKLLFLNPDSQIPRILIDEKKYFKTLPLKNR